MEPKIIDKNLEDIIIKSIRYPAATDDKLEQLCMMILAAFAMSSLLL